MIPAKYLGKLETMANYSEDCNAQMKAGCGVKDLSIKLSSRSEPVARRGLCLLEKQ